MGSSSGEISNNNVPIVYANSNNLELFNNFFSQMFQLFKAASTSVVSAPNVTHAWAANKQVTATSIPVVNVTNLVDAWAADKQVTAMGSLVNVMQPNMEKGIGVSETCQGSFNL